MVDGIDVICIAHLFLCLEFYRSMMHLNIFKRHTREKALAIDQAPTVTVRLASEVTTVAVRA